MIKIDWDFAIPKNYTAKVPTSKTLNEMKTSCMAIIAKALPTISVFRIFNKYMESKLTIEQY